MISYMMIHSRFNHRQSSLCIEKNEIYLSIINIIVIRVIVLTLTIIPLASHPRGHDVTSYNNIILLSLAGWQQSCHVTMHGDGVYIKCDKTNLFRKFLLHVSSELCLYSIVIIIIISIFYYYY